MYIPYISIYVHILQACVWRWRYVTTHYNTHIIIIAKCLCVWYSSVRVATLHMMTTHAHNNYCVITFDVITIIIYTLNAICNMQSIITIVEAS